MLSLPIAAGRAPVSNTRCRPCPPPNKCVPPRQEQASSFPPDSCEPRRGAPRSYLAPSEDRSESASSTLAKQEATCKHLIHTTGPQLSKESRSQLRPPRPVRALRGGGTSPTSGEISAHR